MTKYYDIDDLDPSVYKKFLDKYYYGEEARLDFVNRYKNEDSLRKKINLDALRNYKPYIIEKDNETGEEKTLNCMQYNLSDLLKFSVRYEMFGIKRKISYGEIIMNLPIINISELLSCIENSSLTELFIDTFRIDEYYSTELSDLLLFNINSKLIERYAHNLDWNVIIKNNTAISLEDIKKYYVFIRRCKNFYTNEFRNFDDDALIKFLIEEESKEIDIDSHFCLSFKMKLEDILSNHKLSEKTLQTLIDSIKKNKVFKEKANFLLDTTIDKIFETQDYTENFILKNKTKFKKFTNDFCCTANFSEEFIRENADNKHFINWICLSMNPHLYCGEYSLDFYKDFSDRIDWDSFDLSIFRKIIRSNKNYKEYFYTIKEFISKKSRITDFLKDNENSFTINELVQHFKEEILADRIKSYWCLNKRYVYALYKLNHPNFSMLKFLEERNFNKETVKTYKKAIFEAMLNNELSGLKEEKLNKLNQYLDEIRQEGSSKNNG